MQIISRFEHGSTLDSLRLGPEVGHFAADRDGYAFRRRTAKHAYSGEDVMDYHGKGDRLEVALSISGPGAIRAGLDELGSRRVHVIRDEAAFKIGIFCLWLMTKDILGNTQPEAVVG